ncbi:hypothetical protein CTheo_7674 [Ceratobasidium theobromae]|uniref:Ribosomal RNA methyltransferase FtsJ domain-containing protein n=1 Tax=Ceratobasidium theobromae TaxID=1582974 RepID=A0A5N5QBT1_9AGAM|nr:hypothetical protein CTheo_7674 [Ceratobasidium theobromae]
MVESRPNSPSTDQEFELETQLLFGALCASQYGNDLRRLGEIRRLGWASADVDQHFRRERFQADYIKHDHTDELWCQSMHDSLKYMDYDNRRFVRTNRYLDIGCLPGGYSTYVLRTCPNAVGMGISLPTEEGGHGYAIPQDVRHRIDVHLADLTLFDLAPAMPKPDVPEPSGSCALACVLAPIPFALNSFDFVIGDAHNSRLHPDNELRPWSWTRLLISQVLLALHAVENNGTIFLKLSRVECPLTARILLAFSRIAGYTHTIKSKMIHRKRGTFYLLARGIRVYSFEYRRFVAGLQKLWCIMTFGGDKGYGRDIKWVEQDLITPWKTVLSPNGVNKIAQLGVHMWRIQFGGLLKFLLNLGIEVHVD